MVCRYPQRSRLARRSFFNRRQVPSTITCPERQTFGRRKLTYTSRWHRLHWLAGSGSASSRFVQSAIRHAFLVHFRGFPKCQSAQVSLECIHILHHAVKEDLIQTSGWVTSNVPSVTTIFLAVAIHNSGAGVGSLISQWIWLPSEQYTGYTTGNAVCAACSACVVCTAVGLRLYYGHLNKQGIKDVNGKERVWLL